MYSKIKNEKISSGDRQILGTWNGEVYYVEVTEVIEPPYAVYALGDQVKTKTFLLLKRISLVRRKSYLQAGICYTNQWSMGACAKCNMGKWRVRKYILFWRTIDH